MNPHAQTALAFGTGGIRALMGEGDDKINCATIARITQGLAVWLKTQIATPLVFVGFDARIGSKEFAHTTAKVLAGNGIRVLLLSDVRPTPYISFGCVHYGCSAAVMITASHNPAEYNGYKVYGADGGQLTGPHDSAVAEAIAQNISVSEAPLNSPLIEKVGDDLDAEYLHALLPLQKQPEQNKSLGASLRVVYTNLHGVGITLVPQALRMWGFTDLCTVKAQSVPDGHFPTVRFPNPEYPEALSLGILDMQKENADILIATDPDADRMGAAIMHKGKSVILTGNELAVLFLAYICRFPLPSHPFAVKTLVTTDLCHQIAKEHGLACFDVLTGFKYIAEKIHRLKNHTFVFGAEESYGYLFSSYTRDKDAIAAACLVSEMALDAKIHGETLVDRLKEIYKTYGMYRQKQLSISCEEGSVHAIMQTLRRHLPSHLCGFTVTKVQDFILPVADLPSADMIAFDCSAGMRLIVRPSGTEPKIKLYASLYAPPSSDIEKAQTDCDKQLEALLVAASDMLSRGQRTDV